MELSTIIPTVSINPANDNKLIDIPAKYKKNTDTIKAIGILIPISNEERQSLKNISIIKNPRTIP